ncbi:hypothetical protein L8S15_14920 [Vibrio sp. S/42/10]|uniref:hypothetical protein n=1 Tax=Vibrio sp. S/42/10 TaxID=2914757 RepID=UPI00246976C4|nr:hypothetical protein [Vibrio sp. S/42/10]MDH5880386.1 hypothetical protein [Vibrio sp. S/42/10]
MTIRKIAVIDDDPNSRRNMGFMVEDSGFEPILIDGHFGKDKNRLLDAIFEHDVYGVVSDHHLSPGKLASFYGAELLADLYDSKVPSILITQFFDEDADTSIRRFRQKLPVVIGRGGNDDDDLIGNLLNLSKRELENGPNFDRKPHRALIRIDDFNSTVAHGAVEGVITNWNSDVIVKFPLDIIPSSVRSKLSTDDVNRLMAFVNTGAEDSKDIFITDIHLAPNFEGLDGLD